MAESSTFPQAKEVIENLERRYQLMMTMEPDLQLFREIHGYVKVVEETHGLQGHFLYESYEQWHLLRAEIRRTNDIDRASVEETLHEFYFWPVYDELWQVYGAVETFMHILEKDTKPETGRRFAMQLSDFAIDGFMEQDNHFNLRKDRYKNWLRFVHPIFIAACNTHLSHPVIEESERLRLNEEDGVLEIGNHLVRLYLRNEKTNGFYLMQQLMTNPSERFDYADLATDVADDPETGWRKYFRAAEDVQDKIIKQTQGAITDFLIITSGKTGFVQINKIYLPPDPLPETSG